MKKIILFALTILSLFCNVAYAKVFTLESNFVLGSSSATYDAEIGKFEWKTTNNNWMQLFNELKGQITRYKHLKINITEATHSYRLLFYKGKETIVKNLSDEDTNVDLDLTTLDLKDGWTIDDIERICISGATDGTGSFIIKPSDVILATDDIETMTITTTVDSNSDINTPFQWYQGTEPRTASIANNIGKTGNGISVLLGYSSNNSEDKGYFNLNGYSKVRVKVKNFDDSKNKNFRVMSADDNHSVVTMTGNETLVPCNVTKCTSLKSGGSGQNIEQEIASIDFIGEYQATQTASPFNIGASKSSNISYDRIFTKNKTCTICLPFSLTAEEVDKLGKVYTLSAVNNAKATFTAVNTTEAYKPYLLSPSSDGKLLEEISTAKDITDVPDETKISVSGGYSFIGTLQAKNGFQTDGVEIYGFSASEGKFVHVSSKASINAFRAYILIPSTAVPSAAARSIDILFSETTGLNTIQNVQKGTSAATYNIAGKRVGKSYKGIIVRNNKKIVQK